MKNTYGMYFRKYKNNIIMWAFLFLIFALAPTHLVISTGKIHEFYMEEKFSKFPYSYPPMFHLNEDDKEWVEKTLLGMTTKEKCAQMVMPWVLGKFVNEDSPDYERMVSLVENSKVGGLIFFKGDIMNEATLINKMQELAEVPLLVASDFERGLAMRLTDAIEFPYNMAVAATGEPELSYKMGKAVGEECRAIGVTQNYAPVTDINNNPRNPIINIRAYSEDKDTVARYAAEFIKGAAEARVLTTAKHFPGHGDTYVDSHMDMPVINVGKLELAKRELIPFKVAIDAGVHSVMVGHLEVPAIEKQEGLPATLSKAVITDLLKNELEFKGLVVTDAMNMSAVTKYFSVADATVKAIEAGVDILLMPPDEDIAINAIYKAVETGEIDIKRIDESVRKILSAKKWLGLDDERYTDVDELNKTVNKKTHLRLAERIAEKSITLVKNKKNVIPLDPFNYSKTVVITITDGYGSDEEKIFQDNADKRFDGLTKVFLNRRARSHDYSRALRIARRADLILLPAFIKVKAMQGTVELSSEHERFINSLLKVRAPVIFMSFGNPYLLAKFPQSVTYLTAYGDPKVSQDAMLDAITGITDITGKLPVSIPYVGYSIGEGITLNSTTLRFTDDEADTSYDFSYVEELMEEAIDDEVFPGAVLLVGKRGRVIFEKAFGRYTYDDESTIMTPEAMFDLASLTKVVATTSAAMILYDSRKLSLDKKVSDYLPAFGNNGKENITIRNLLMHNSGLIAYRNYMKMYDSKKKVIDAIMHEKLEYPTGSKTVYSDLNMIILQQVIEKITGQGLDEFIKKKLFIPLKMMRTMFNPPKEFRFLCPPTSEVNELNRSNKGVVHDGNAYILGGVAGHAGLFSTAYDLAVFAEMILQSGKYGDKQFIKASTIERWTKRQNKSGSRALGWDTKSAEGSSAGNYFSDNSIGHTGFTGTSLWIDKDKDIFVILLSNRVYPDEENTSIIAFRPKIHNAIMQAIMD